MQYFIENHILKKETGNDAEFTVPEDVTEIGEKAFHLCTRLTQINIPDSVTEIGKAPFRGCTSLTQINIPEGVTKISNEAF